MQTFRTDKSGTTSERISNRGKLIGPKPPLQPKHVWAIRTRLQLSKRVRDLALFNLAIDSKLRGCDVVRLRVDDVAPNGYALDRATIRQRKTGRPVKFEITEQTRQAIDEYLKLVRKDPGNFLFTGRRGKDQNLTTRQYARLVSGRSAQGLGSDRENADWLAVHAVSSELVSGVWIPKFPVKQGINREIRDI